MKLVKKILRLIPCLFIIGGLISCIIYSNNPNMVELGTPLTFFNFEGGMWDEVSESLNYIIIGTPFESLHEWVQNNLSYSYLISWCFWILVYELFLSLMFLMFDFINMVFDWANKFIKKGGNLDD